MRKYEKMTGNQDRDLSAKERAMALVSRMTLQQKISQMLHDAPEIPELGIPRYNWWNECLHGVARAGTATVFPQAIGLAATFNTDLHSEIARAISDEARAKHHEALRKNDRSAYKGLTYWSPNINIYRDPRWGRGHETYGEDPYLTAELGIAFIMGLQGSDPDYLKLAATVKHFAAHSGPEAERHGFNAHVSKQDLYETYLFAFKECVRKAKVEAVMGAYNRLNGEACCASKTLMDILRNDWGFRGHYVSDCGAIADISEAHQLVPTKVEAAALAVRNGCDLDCGCTYGLLIDAINAGLLEEADIDRALTRLFTTRFKLGMFEPEEKVSYSQIPCEKVDSKEHRVLARKAARESIVLLKNKGTLPLDRELESIAVIGPNAASLDVLLGNYAGTPSRYVTGIEGIANKMGAAARIYYAKGCELLGDSKEGFSEVLACVEKAKIAIMFIGSSPAIEGEEGDAYNSEAAGDRVNLKLSGVQQELVQAVKAIGKKLILVVFAGGGMELHWAHENVDAMVQVWYCGE